MSFNYVKFTLLVSLYIPQETAELQMYY